MSEKNNPELLVEQARQSFEKVLAHKTYASIIKDDKHLQLLMEMAPVRSGNSVVDIGTGTGYLAFPLAKAYPFSDVYGIDIARNIIDQNSQTAKDQGLRNLHFLAFDGLNYPFEPETFDLAVTRYALHHFPQLEISLEKITSVLKPDAYFLVSDPVKNEDDHRNIIDSFMKIKGDGHICFYQTEELKTVFEKHGFCVEQQVITNMKFPFPRRQEYLELFNHISDSEKEMYHMSVRDGVVWVENLQVANTLFQKRH